MKYQDIDDLVENAPLTDDNSVECAISGDLIHEFSRTVKNVNGINIQVSSKYDNFIDEEIRAYSFLLNDLDVDLYDLDQYEDMDWEVLGFPNRLITDLMDCLKRNGFEATITVEEDEYVIHSDNYEVECFAYDEPNMPYPSYYVKDLSSNYKSETLYHKESVCEVISGLCPIY